MTVLGAVAPATEQPTPPSLGATFADVLALFGPQRHQASAVQVLAAAGRELPADVTVDVGPVQDVTRALCDDDSEPGTVTVSYFTGDGAHRCFDAVCVETAVGVMRDAVDFDSATYLDVEVRLAAVPLAVAA